MPVGVDDHIGPKNVGILGRCASIDPYNCVVYDSALNDNLAVYRGAVNNHIVYESAGFFAL